MGEDPNFNQLVDEDWFAWEEMVLGEDSKCRKRGSKKRDKFKPPNMDKDKQ